jgi:glycerol dehydrogenase-like iron-containing ADH family enzyme
MLAAQAIAEKDRGKALQALMTNLLISNYNQARGVLDLVWPDERQPQFTVQSLTERKSPATGFRVPRLLFGDHLLENFDPPEEQYTLVTMEELWPKVKDRFKRHLSCLVFVRDLDWYGLEAMERALPVFDLVVGLGGGVAQDAAKYLAWKRHTPVDEFVTISSVDASVTKSVAARAGGHVTYIGYIVPRNVYVDFPLILSAPARLNRSGVGDILCAHVALWDWQYARDRKGEAYDPHAAQAMRAWLDRIRDNAESIQAVSREGVRLIMEAFEDISLICRRFGSSRPQEGSEHTFAYNAEFQTGKHFLHGELVALGAWVMASLQENHPEYLIDIYTRTGICWQPQDLGLSRTEFIRILSTLNWYQKNFGRRYTILNEQTIDQAFIERIVAQLTFGEL